MPSRKTSVVGKKKEEKEIETSPPGQLVPLPSLISPRLSRHEDELDERHRYPPSLPSSFFSSFSYYTEYRSVDFLKEHKGMLSLSLSFSL